MSQNDVVTYLKRHPDSWVTYDELERNLNISPNTLKKNIRSLTKNGEIIRIHSIRDPLMDGMTETMIAWIKLNNDVIE